MKKKIKGKLIQYGFQRPTILLEDHIFGSTFYAGASVINPSGQWDAFLPKYEPQAENYETQGCTVWGTENALEILHKLKFGVEKNYEELPVYIGSKVHPNLGGNPNTVAQWIRENGLVEAPLYPFPKTLDELLSLLEKPLDVAIAEKGKQWNYDVRHQWVLQGGESKQQRIEAIKGALQYGVLGVSVTAWFRNAEDVYVDNGMANTHWCVCYGWTDKGFKIFDSYDHSEKIYSFDSVISFAKLYFLEKKLTVEQKKSLWQVISAFLFGEPQELKKLEPILMPTETKPKDKLKELCVQSIGEDLSTVADNRVACAESTSTILQGIFPDFPRFLSTIALKLHLDMDKRFQRCEAEAWTIIDSPTSGKNIGHCGFLGESGIIYSNNSQTGKWDSHWTLDKWIAHYRMERGLKIYFYKIT